MVKQIWACLDALIIVGVEGHRDVLARLGGALS